jgi:dimethylaniline monooxygenase (N-oxide forming)
LSFDHTLTRRVGTFMRTFCYFCPDLMASMMNTMIKGMRKKNFPDLVKSHPSFQPPRVLDGIPHRLPFLNDDIDANIASGTVECVPGVAAFTGPRSVELTDGSTLDDIDAVVVCSGYHYDFSLVHGAGNPVDPAAAPDGYAALAAQRFHSPDSPFPRLYRGILSEQFPDSLCFLGHMVIMRSTFAINDLASMAVAGVWRGDRPLPTAAEMRRDIDAQYDFVVANTAKGPVPHPGFRMVTAADTYQWLNEAAGTGVEERLGPLGCWSLRAWKLWWQDRKFYNLLMGGIDTPFVYRLFETGKAGRKVWPDAKAAIIESNRQVDELREKFKAEQQAKKMKQK